MGLFDIFTRARKRPPTEQDSGYSAASIRIGEEHAAASVNALNQVDFNRVGRAIAGSIWNATSIIATECAAHQLRLYRRAGSGTRTKRAERVTRKQSDFLRGRSAGIRVTSKQAAMADSAGDIEEVFEHPALELLADPDPVTTASDFLTMLFWYREAAGKCYVWTGEPTSEGPSGLYILHPQFTQPVLDRSEFITAYRYGRETTDILEVPADQVIFSPYQRDPFRPWDGISWLSSVEQYADAENAALTTEVNRWKNAGQPGFILKVPMSYTDQQMKQAEAALRGKSGPFAAGRALIIREAELVQAAARSHEMGYVQGLEQAEKAIYRAAGIPEAIWKLNDANLAGAKMGERLLLRSCFKRMRRVAEDLTAYLLPMFGEEPGALWFGYENPDIEDQQTEATIMQGAFSAGVVTVNEYRRVLYLDPVHELPDVPAAAQAIMDQQAAANQVAAPMVGAEGQSTAEVGAEVPAENAEEPAAEVSPADTALNGAQVDALARLAQSVADGQLPPQSGRAIAAAAFPTVAPSVLDAVFSALNGFSPRVEEPDGKKPVAATSEVPAPNQSAPVAKRRGRSDRAGTRKGRGVVGATDRGTGDKSEAPTAIEDKAMPENMIPPKGAQEEAARGLEWRREHGRGGTAVGVARARDIANGRALSPETIMRVVSYFARHEVDKQGQGWNPGEEGFPSAGRIAWALWGGDAMRTYADRMAAKIREARGESKA